jgi:hypothetical protein
MKVPARDVAATAAVLLAVVAYALWLADVEVLGTTSVRGVGAAVLVLGFVASALAVVPGFDQLIRGNRAYLAAMSLLGVVALVSGVVALWEESETALGLMVAAVVVLWGVSTTHHVLLARAAPHRSGPAR